MTSANELTRQARIISRSNRLNPDKAAKKTYIEECFSSDTPVIMATDYIKLYGEQLREFMPNNFIVLGTDGYGRSDSRENLREFFEVNRYHIVVSALSAIEKEGIVTAKKVKDAIKKYNIDSNSISPEKK